MKEWLYYVKTQVDKNKKAATRTPADEPSLLMTMSLHSQTTASAS